MNKKIRPANLILTMYLSDLFKGALKPYIALLSFHVCWKFHPIFLTSQPVVKIFVQELRIYHKMTNQVPSLGEKLLRSTQDQISAEISFSERRNKRKIMIFVIDFASDFGNTFVNLKIIYLSDTFCNFCFLIVSIIWLNV